MSSTVLDVAVNGIDLGRGRGGNETYLQGVLTGLADDPRVRSVIVLIGAHGPSALQQPNVHYLQTGPYQRLPYLLWQQSRALRGMHFDWFLSTYFLPLLAPPRSALFVHDLSFLSLPSTYPLSIRWYMRWLVGAAVRRARVLFVLSEFVRAEFRTYFPHIPADRIVVVHPGYDRAFQASPQRGDEVVRTRYGLPSDYILSVSSIHPRKNLLGLLGAYQKLRTQMGDAPPLIIVGQRYWGQPQLEAQAQAMEARLLGYVPQSDLPAIYRGARLLVYPSIYEGFGLPPLEAMASGVPVVCGDNTSLPEVVGDAALMINVRSPALLANAMARVLTEHAQRELMRASGLARAELFHWRHTAQALVTSLFTASDL